MNSDPSGGGAFLTGASPPDKAPPSRTGGDLRIELDRETCLAMLGGGGIGRIGVSVGALPAILPVDYVVAGETIAFPADVSNIARRTAAGVVIAFEVDGENATGTLDWTVMVQGVSREIVKPDELAPFQSMWKLRRPTFSMPSAFVAVPTDIISGQRVLGND